MRHFISRIAPALAGHAFFQQRYLCDSGSARQRFDEALDNARRYYAAHSHTRISPALIHESWQQNIAALESYFVDRMDMNFMSNPVINGTMVFTDRKAHKQELRSISDALGRISVEKIVSRNLNAAFLAGKCSRSTLINSTHHLYHLVQFERATGRKISTFESVIEFGGGYGNMARIIGNLSSCKNYSIIDLLLFSCIQYVFLSTVMGSTQVAFHDQAPDGAARSVVLYPLFRSDLSANLRGELFLSTWALSESTRATYEWVTAHDWFGATSLLLAYHEQWTPWQSGELEESLDNSGWRIIKQPITFLPGSFYLFATR